ncbi:MAG: PCYCGC motif-containing (lipo)protein [Nitrososphaerales archaeon]
MPKIRRRRVSKRKNDKSNTIFGAVFLAVIILVAGLVVWAAATRGEADTGGVELPSYAYRADVITQAYIASVKLGALFEYIPCYCGCADMPHLPYPHKHLRDCYINDLGQFIPHAASCNTCIEEATIVWTMFREDAKPIEIRNAIDEKYSRGGYPPPTPTPLPPS